MCQSIGYFPIGTIGLGILSATSRILVPLPPHKITVFITPIQPLSKSIPLFYKGQINLGIYLFEFFFQTYSLALKEFLLALDIVKIRILKVLIVIYYEIFSAFNCFNHLGIPHKRNLRICTKSSKAVDHLVLDLPWVLSLNLAGTYI